MGVRRDKSTLPVIWADQNVTRRKWYQILATPQGDHSFHSRRLGECLEAAEADGHSVVLLKLPNGNKWRMERVGDERKEP